jgi:SAM-dependent methyltransferase
MNIIRLMEQSEAEGRQVDLAYGADFSDRLIEAAKAEAKQRLPVQKQAKLSFVVARNEHLVEDLTKALGVKSEALLKSFHLLLGVNTFRYCHRLGKARESAQDIADLLVRGGICVMIDMNPRFPAFRSRLRDLRTKPKVERYLPSLKEHTLAFEQAGLEILRSTCFCWIPHSGGPLVTRICSALTPILNTIARPVAMRCLVVSRKP